MPKSLLLLALAATLHPAPASADAQAPGPIERARLASAGIDQELRSESGAKLGAAEDPTLKRLGAGIAAAAVPRWTGTPQVAEIPTPVTGERQYKISNGTTTYCTRIPSASIGTDRYERMRTNNPAIRCPR